ncbi:MAG: anthranilate phosphoribosyltransferase [Flavobacteriaceae bacterium]|nr:anthranilate phosphoribosyltransferase [Flavobacteriaceae bacterium]OUX39035.1 MAG: anthranilate phosphoribosyltransferase [Flavobacteriaceae bacterium TMED265]
MKEILNQLINHESLTKEQARSILINIASGTYNSHQVAAFMTVYMMRSIDVQELEGFRDALLELCVTVPLEDYNLIDLCGTGGDGKDTFNISTLASFVTAGAGVQVSKHGNYGVSSKCGSSNVLESLGVTFSNDGDFLKKCVDEAGICVLHAPLFHPAMKNVAPIRKDLGVKTFFNMLGPMVNPAFPKNQMVGVFNLELARKYGYLYQNTDKSYAIVHALDGYDEISLTGGSKIITPQNESIIYPSTFGLDTVEATAIVGGETVEDSAEIFRAILNGNGSQAQNRVVCANAAVAIATAEHCSLNTAYEKAEESLLEKKALNTLKKLQALSAEL